MLYYRIINDKVVVMDEVHYLLFSKEDKEKHSVPGLSDDYDGWFPFLRMCHTIGDYAITSGIFEALKTKHPKIQIALPTDEYLLKFFGEAGLEYYSSGTNNGLQNFHIVNANNPHIDYYYNFGEFENIFTDHERCYTSLVKRPNGDIRSCDEPLAEQILRRFGFTEEELKTIDSRPKLYFSNEEKEKGDAFIKSHMGNSEYGCLLFSARIEEYRNEWQYDTELFNASEQYSDYPVFYYSNAFDLETTKWKKRFNTAIDFSKTDLTIREQLYVKSNAKFNIGYQAGVTDAISGTNTECHVLTPYYNISECCIRGVTYYFSDGSIKRF